MAEDKDKGNLKMEEGSATNFPKLMMDVDAGLTANVIGQMLSDVAFAVANTNRAGEVNIKIKLKPGNSADNSHLDMNTELKVKEPKMTKGYKTEDTYHGTIVYVGKRGKLTYDRPKEDVNGQLNLDDDGKLKEVRTI